eukprot:c7908_g1_i1.p1 GENE.c7908_g1_i1~~c7908_g1_i1.p1  ORF type:complete len:273 (+),score=79.80 c7908_g1_i1:843-1661(+)
MHIFVNIHSRSIPVDVSEMTHTSELMQLIYEKEGIPPSMQHLVLCGRSMASAAPISLVEGQNVHVLLRIEGGGRDPNAPGGRQYEKKKDSRKRGAGAPRQLQEDWIAEEERGGSKSKSKAKKEEEAEDDEEGSGSGSGSESESEEEESEEESEEDKKQKPKANPKAASAKKSQPKPQEAEEEEEEDEEVDLGLPPNRNKAAPGKPNLNAKPELSRREREEIARQKAKQRADAETTRRDLERLALLKKQQEDAKRRQNAAAKPAAGNGKPPSK